MEFKTRINPISAAYFLGEKCTEVIKGYRMSINAFPLSDDPEFRILSKVTDYELFEYVIDRKDWDYSLLSLEYNRILEVVKAALTTMPEMESLPVFAKKSVENILTLAPINSSK